MEKKRTDDARPDYLQQSKQALKDQAAEVVSAASRIAGQAQEAAAAKGNLGRRPRKSARVE
jgi:hypothetical protein